MTSEISLAHAKAILKNIERCQDGKKTKQEVLGEYKEVLNLVVDAISKLAAEEQQESRAVERVVAEDEEEEEEEEIDVYARDDASETSITVPETVATTDSSSPYARPMLPASPASQSDEKPKLVWEGRDQESRQRRQLHTTHPYTRRESLEYSDDDKETREGEGEENDEDCEDDDVFSVCSDFVPLTMTDDDALDEISLTRELMGYEEGFAPQSYCTPIKEEEEETISAKKQQKKEKKILKEKSVPEKKILKKENIREGGPSAKPPRSHRDKWRLKKQQKQTEETGTSQPSKPFSSRERQQSVGSAPLFGGSTASSEVGSLQGSTQSAPAAIERVCEVCKHLPANERCKDGFFCI